MSDELAIQPQIIQPKKDNSALYGGIGALAGAGAGYYGIPALTGKKIASHDDIIKDAKDSVDLSTKYSKADSATIDEVKAAAQEVKKLQEELKNLPEKTLPADAQELKDFEAVKKERQEAIEKLVKQKTAELERNGGNISQGDKILKFDPNKCGPHDWPDKNQKGKKITSDTMAKEYFEHLKNKVNDAKSNFGPEIREAEGRVKTAEDAISEYFDAMYKDKRFKNKSGNISGYKVHREFNKPAEELYSNVWRKGADGFWKVVKKYDKVSPYGQAVDAAEKILPDLKPHTLTYEDYKQFAEITETYQKGAIPQKIFNPETGKHETKYIKFEKQQLFDYINEKNKEIAERRKDLTNELYESARMRIFDQRAAEPENIKKEFVEDTMRGRRNSIRKAGLLKGKGKSTTFDVEALIQEDKDHKGGWTRDIKALNKAKINKTPLSSVTLECNYGATTGKTIDQILEMAKARKDLFYDKDFGFQAYSTDATKRVKNSVQNISIVSELKEKAANLAANDPKYQEAMSKLKSEFSMLVEEGVIEGGRTPEEIERLANEYAEKNLSSELKSRFNDLETKYNKALETKGVANADAKKAVEEKIAKAEGELSTKAKSLAEKLGGMSGKNKALCAIGGAAIAGLATWFASKPSEA